MEKLSIFEVEYINLLKLYKNTLLLIILLNVYS